MDTYDADTKRRFDELIPWYITGQLKDSDRAWIDKMAAEHSALSAELDWHRNLHREIHSKYAGVRADVGLDSLLARMREERRPVRQERFADKLRELFASLATRPAYALGAVVVVVQAGIIGALLTNEPSQAEFAETRAIAPRPVHESPVLQVTFKADAIQRNMNLLLVRVGGNVIAGPSQVGEYIVEVVPQNRIELARKELEGSGLVEVVTVLDKRPARE